MTTANSAKQAREVAVSEKDLPLHCPSSQSSSWAEHPKVYLPLDKADKVICPYCATVYRKAP